MSSSRAKGLKAVLFPTVNQPPLRIERGDIWLRCVANRSAIADWPVTHICKVLGCLVYYIYIYIYISVCVRACAFLVMHENVLSSVFIIILFLMAFPVKNVTNISSIFKVMECYTIRVRQRALTQGLCYWIYSKCQKNTPPSLRTHPDMPLRIYLDYLFYSHCTYSRSVRGHRDLLTSPVKFFYLRRGTWKRMWYISQQLKHRIHCVSK